MRGKCVKIELITHLLLVTSGERLETPSSEDIHEVNIVIVKLGDTYTHSMPPL